MSEACQLSAAVQKLLDVLSILSTWVDEIPPAQKEGLRYGNPSYRVWHARMTDQAVPLMQSVLPDQLSGSGQEIAPYFLESFGNATRIDYGTGHETNFCALLYCLARLGVVGPQDRQALVLKVFAQYVALMRKIQTTYWWVGAEGRVVRGGCAGSACVELFV